MFSSVFNDIGGLGAFGGLSGSGSSSGIIQGDQELAGGFFAGLPVDKPVSSKPAKPSNSDLFDRILNGTGTTKPSKPSNPESVFDSISGRIGVYVPPARGENSGGASLPPSIRDDVSQGESNKKHLVHGALAGGATALLLSTIGKKSMPTSLTGGLVVGSVTYWAMVM